MGIKILGVGLSKTGTSSLNTALNMLGFSSRHFTSRLYDVLDGRETAPTFRRYDDVDAITDVPEAWFYREILDAYPECKAILTTRDIESWWSSISVHFNVTYPVIAEGFAKSNWGKEERQLNTFRRLLRNYVYGSTFAHEFLFKKRFVEHTQRVLADVPSHKLLVMNIIAGDGWQPLCRFLNVEEPNRPFPHRNRTV